MTEAHKAEELSPSKSARESATDAGRSLLIARSGPRTFALYADETDGAIEYVAATPLPFAPPSILGLIAARGRIRTLIDPAQLFQETGEKEAADLNDDEAEESPRLALLLKSDEQLALAVERVERLEEVSLEAFEPSDSGNGFLRGYVAHEGARIYALDPARLFEAATRGMERRRKR